MTDISPKAFYKYTGKMPTTQTLLVANCPFGLNMDPEGYSHENCGWCPEHNTARDICKCKNTSAAIPVTIDGKHLTVHQWDITMEPLFDAAITEFMQEMDKTFKDILPRG